MTTLYDIRKSAIEELEDLIENQDPDESIHEIADSSVPVYTGDLMQLAADNIDLATNTPELGPAFDGSPTPVNIVAANVYEYIVQELHDALHELQEA